MTDDRESVVVADAARRPGTPRPYDFPPFERGRARQRADASLIADLPGRPLVTRPLVLRNGAADEPAAEAGATVLRPGR